MPGTTAAAVENPGEERAQGAGIVPPARLGVGVLLGVGALLGAGALLAGEFETGAGLA